MKSSQERSSGRSRDVPEQVLVDLIFQRRPYPMGRAFVRDSSRFRVTIQAASDEVSRYLVKGLYRPWLL